MARNDEPKVSLFPFMSVLACTIGVLSLMLTSLALSAVTPPDAPPGPPAEAPGAAGRAGAKAGSASQSRSSASSRVDRIERLWAEVDRLLAGRGGDAEATLDALEASLASQRQAHRLEDDLAEIARAERALEAEGDTLEAEVAVLESRRETLPILIDPTGLSRHLDPWFVECDAKGATAYRASGGYGHFVPRDELTLSGDYGRYLRRLRALPGSLLVLLVRPDGLRTAAVAESIAESADVRVSRLPLPGKGELDWSLLARAEKAGER